MSLENVKMYLDKYFLIIMVLFLVIISLFIKNPYFYHILILGGIYSILAIGLNILMVLQVFMLLVHILVL